MTNKIQCFLALILLCWWWCFPVYSQNPVRQSIKQLEQKLNTTAEGRARLPILLELVKTCKEVENTDALKYAEMGAELSRKFNDRLYLSSFLVEIGHFYYRQGTLKKSLQYYFQGLNLRRPGDDKKWFVEAYNYLANTYLRQGDMNKALAYYHKSLKINQTVGDKKNMMASIGNIGIVYYKQGKYREALEYDFKSLKLREEAADKKGMVNSYVNIGLVYYSLGQWDQALENYIKSVKLAEELGNIRTISDTYFFIGNLYQHKKNYPLAIDYYSKGLKIKKQIGAKDGVSYSYMALGSIYAEQKQYDLALLSLAESIRGYTEIENKEGLANAMFWSGKCYQAKGQYTLALDFLRKAYDYSKELDIPLLLRDTAQVLDEIYVKLNRFKEAYQYHVIFKEKSDSLNIKENVKKITRMQMQYDFDKKQKQQELEQEKKDLQKAAELKQQRFLKFAFSGLAIVVAFVFFVLFQIKVKDNRRLHKEIRNRKQAQRELLYSMKMETVGILAAGIAHDFNNLLAIISGNLSMAEACLEDISNEPNPYVTRAQKASDQAADLVKNFLTLSEGGWAQKKNTSLADIINETLAAPEIKNTPITVEIPTDTISLYADERQLRQVLVNLLINADEATAVTSREKKISLVAAKLSVLPGNPYKLNPGDYLEILISDNGKGIPPELLEKIFDPYFSTKMRGTQKGMGLSLAVCAAIMQRHHGHIYFTSQMDKGTTVHLFLPVEGTPVEENRV